MTPSTNSIPCRSLSPFQRKVYKILKAGGLMYDYKTPANRICQRLLDKDRNPIMLIGSRTLKALKNKERIERNSEGHWVYKPIKRRRRNDNTN